MIYFLRRGGDALTCETRRSAAGDGYELVVTERGVARVEAFATVPDMLAREHELLNTWRGQGWHDAGPGAPADDAGRDDWYI